MAASRGTSVGPSLHRRSSRDSLGDKGGAKTPPEDHYGCGHVLARTPPLDAVILAST